MSNPYQDLKQEATDFANKVLGRGTTNMCYFPKNELSTGYDLRTVYEKVDAANQLGFDVQLFVSDRGLEVKYIPKLPRRPWRF